MEFIDEKMKANDELTSAEIKIKLVDEFGLDVSQSTIRRIRQVGGMKIRVIASLFESQTK